MKQVTFCSMFCLLTLCTPAFANQSADNKDPAKPVSAAQFLSAQRALFSQADKNYDGRVTRDEIQHLKWKKDKPKHKKAFAKIDTNNNGYLDYEEVEATHEARAEARAQRGLKAKDRFLKTYDKDQNGVITAAEVNEAFKKQADKARAYAQTNASRDFEGKDTDDSGLITLEEYLQSKTMANTLQQLQTASGSKPITRDPNRDGIITRIENEQFATEALAALDKNKNDEISAQEQSNIGFKSSQSFTSGVVYFRTGKGMSFDNNRPNIVVP